MGIHGQYFDLNNESVLEPRIGATYKLTGLQSLSIAYGKHSRLEPLNVYFARVEMDNQVQNPNKKLDITKSHHLVLAYDLSINPDLRLKIEPYFQYLYDVPVINDSSYSVINMEAEWYFTNKLVNEGSGKNYGIDVTLERFLKNGYYYLVTGSLFDSKYTGGDNVERNTRYNTGYVINLLFGKEWLTGKNKNKIFGINGRLNIMGGQRITPVDEELSLNEREVRYNYNKIFEEQKANIYHMNVSVNYRINKKNHASIWSLQVLNAFGTKEDYGKYYDYKSNTIQEEQVVIVVPSISYKLEF